MAPGRKTFPGWFEWAAGQQDLAEEEQRPHEEEEDDDEDEDMDEDEDRDEDEDMDEDEDVPFSIAPWLLTIFRRVIVNCVAIPARVKRTRGYETNETTWTRRRRRKRRSNLRRSSRKFLRTTTQRYYFSFARLPLIVGATRALSTYRCRTRIPCGVAVGGER